MRVAVEGPPELLPYCDTDAKKIVDKARALMVLFTHLHCKGMFLNNLVHLYRFPVGYTYTLNVGEDDPWGVRGIVH